MATEFYFGPPRPTHASHSDAIPIDLSLSLSLRYYFYTTNCIAFRLPLAWPWLEYLSFCGSPVDNARVSPRGRMAEGNMRPLHQK